MELEPLPYKYDALEPYIDEQTMKIHHDKHHQAYFDNFMKAIAGTPLEGKDVKEVLSDLSSIPEEIKTAVVNHGGGYFHHSFFWKILKKDVPFEGPVADAIKEKWGSFDKFKEEFSKKALSVFGSGWTWLVKEDLEIINTANQDSPLSLGKTPLLCIDVWEHSYYKKYGPSRAEYIEAWWNVVNWEKVNELFK